MTQKKYWVSDIASQFGQYECHGSGEWTQEAQVMETVANLPVVDH